MVRDWTMIMFRNGAGAASRLYFYWKKAHKAVWKDVSWDIMRFRQEKADALGLTYEEYTLELLDRGRHLQAEDEDRISAIKVKRRPD